MCGMCCKAIVLSQSPEVLEQMADDKNLLSDASFIHANWESITQTEALVINPYLQHWIKHGNDEKYFYRCKLLIDNKCSIHGTEQKPHVCTGYPFYNRIPEKDYLFYTKDCGYQPDLEKLFQELNNQKYNEVLKSVDTETCCSE
jgi:hypothetical protein